MNDHIGRSPCFKRKNIVDDCGTVPNERTTSWKGPFCKSIFSVSGKPCGGHVDALRPAMYDEARGKKSGHLCESQRPCNETKVISRASWRCCARRPKASFFARDMRVRISKCDHKTVERLVARAIITVFAVFVTDLDMIHAIGGDGMVATNCTSCPSCNYVSKQMVPTKLL